jgi:hypothetical protein
LAFCFRNIIAASPWQPRRDVRAIAENVVAVDHHVAPRARPAALASTGEHLLPKIER